VLDVINESQTGLLVDRRPMCAQRHFFAPAYARAGDDRSVRSFGLQR
jgi:hypothetical protein